MADFSKHSVADMAAANPGINAGTEPSMREIDWESLDPQFREHHEGVTWAKADHGYEHYRSGYRFGAEAARRHAGHEWSAVETDLERDWTHGPGSSGSAWTDMKDAIRDAWHRVRHGEAPGSPSRQGGTA